MNDQSDRRRPTRHGLVFAAVYGAVVAAVAYLVAGGNPLWMLIVMIVIGVLLRLYAYLVIRRRGAERPPWWKWL
jgi:RsiW-degrading membrane proteinase PrsW (M82 family)